MRRMLEIAAAWILRGFGYHLADWRLHLIRIGLSKFLIEIQVHGWLVDAVEVLQICERDQPVVAEGMGLVGSQVLSRRAASGEKDGYTNPVASHKLLLRCRFDRLFRRPERQAQQILNEVAFLSRRQPQRHAGVVMVDYCPKICEPAVVIEATLGMGEKLADWRGAITVIGGAIGLE